MRKMLEEMFADDLERILDLNELYNSKSYPQTKKDLEKHDKFWQSLSEKQQNQFREFELVIAGENAEVQKEIYIYAFRKALRLMIYSLIDNQ